MKRGKVQTLEGVARILGAEGFKKYVKDYGNSHINIDGDVADAINLLESYQDDEKLIDHFNHFKREMTEKYAPNSVPFYKTDAFKEQCDQEHKEFGYLISM